MALDGGNYASLLARILALEAEIEDVRLIAEMAQVPHPQASPPAPHPFLVVASGPAAVSVVAGSGVDHAGDEEEIAREDIAGISESGRVYVEWEGGSWSHPLFAAELPTRTPLKHVFPIAEITFADGAITGIRQVRASLLETPRSGDCIAVEMEQVGGTDGDDTTEASWTYDIFALGRDEDEDALFEAEDIADAPHLWTRDIGPMEVATTGIMAYERDGTLVLVWCNERPESGLCPEPEA